MNALLFALPVLVAVWWGYRQGLLSVVSRIAALLLAYALAWQETPSLAQWLGERQWVPVAWAWPVAGTSLLLGGWLLFGLLLRWLVAAMPEEWSKGGRWPGALAGGALGAGFGLVLVWTGGVLQDSWQLRQTAPAGIAQPAPAPAHDPVREWSSAMMASAARAALGDDNPLAGAVSQWVREPLSVGDELRYLGGHPALQGLFRDPVNYRVLVQGPVLAVQRLADFRALVADVRVMQFLSLMGLAGTDSAAREAALAEMLSRYARHFEQVRQLPEYQQLANDPDLRQAAASGSLVALLGNEKVRQFATLMAEGVQAAPVVEVKPSAPAEPKVLYRWQDANGRVHITEQKPPAGVAVDVIQP